MRNVCVSAIPGEGLAVGGCTPRRIKMTNITQESLEQLAGHDDRPVEGFKEAVNTALCRIAESTLAYFATVGADEKSLTMIGWSMSAMLMCKAIDKPLFYKLEETGLWGDAIRERKGVITNDYKGLVKPTKKGYPEGHVNIRRHMNLPIFEGKKIVLVVGVGNKKAEYTNEDLSNVTLYMNGVWPLLKAKLT